MYKCTSSPRYLSVGFLDGAEALRRGGGFCSSFYRDKFCPDFQKKLKNQCTAAKGVGGLFNWGGGGSIEPPGKTPPRRAQLTGPPKSYRADPRAPKVAGPEIRQKRKTGFLESARRGGSEKSSFAMYLLGGKIDHFQWSKKLSAPSASDFIITA